MHERAAPHVYNKVVGVTTFAGALPASATNMTTTTPYEGQGRQLRYAPRRASAANIPPELIPNVIQYVSTERDGSGRPSPVIATCIVALSSASTGHGSVGRSCSGRGSVTHRVHHIAVPSQRRVAILGIERLLVSLPGVSFTSIPCDRHVRLCYSADVV